MWYHFNMTVCLLTSFSIKALFEIWHHNVKLAQRITQLHYNTKNVKMHVLSLSSCIMSQRSIPADSETRNVTSVGVQSQLLGLLSYIFPFRNTDYLCIGASDVNGVSVIVYYLSHVKNYDWLIDWLINGANRQPASRQNRRSEAADDAGIARKRRVMALTAAQCGYALTWVHPGNSQTPLSALSGPCRHDLR